MFFQIKHKDSSSKARIATLNLAHGAVETPLFMPVGTNGALKAISHKTLEDLKINLILANTYHLYLRPGLEVLKKFKSLHNFTSWKGNFLTDSGGFQIFSLSALRKIYEDGVEFKSHIDGKKHYFTPERVVEIQELFKSDILMALDICSSYGTPYLKAREYMHLTTKWAKKTIERYKRREEDYRGALFLITQGNFYKDLRKQSTYELLNLESPGIAIGGISVGEPLDKYLEILEFNAALLPENKPKYVMGIGTPEYILEAVYNGIDIFDCVHPTRIARHGSLLTDEGLLNLNNKKYEMDLSPVDKNCQCTLCVRHSRAFLRHLFKSKESLALMLASEHNIFYMHNFMRKIKEAIKDNNFHNFKKSYLSNFKKGT